MVVDHLVQVARLGIVVEDGQLARIREAERGAREGDRVVLVRVRVRGRVKVRVRVRVRVGLP